MSKLSLTLEGETHVVVTRRFPAPPEAVYRANNDLMDRLLDRWLAGAEVLG